MGYNTATHIEHYEAYREKYEVWYVHMKIKKNIKALIVNKIVKLTNFS